MPKMTGCCGLNMNAHSTHFVQKKRRYADEWGRGKLTCKKTPIKLVITLTSTKKYKAKTKYCFRFQHKKCYLLDNWKWQLKICFSVRLFLAVEGCFFATFPFKFAPSKKNPQKYALQCQNLALPHWYQRQESIEF